MVHEEDGEIRITIKDVYDAVQALDTKFSPLLAVADATAKLAEDHESRLRLLERTGVGSILVVIAAGAAKALGAF